MKSNKIGFIASSTKEAQEALLVLSKKYENVAPDKADLIVALGGDGLLLHALESFGKNDVPVYGMNRGTVGFLMNHYSNDNLIQRIEKAEITTINPLIMKAIDIKENGSTNEYWSMYRGSDTRAGAYYHTPLCQYGDINEDLNIDIFDIIYIVNIILGISNPNEVQICASDINSDGIIDLLDAILVINIIVED